MRYGAALAALVIAVIGAATHTARAQDSVMGTWTGPVTQIDTNTAYSIKMTLTRDGGESFYPELSCGGALKRVGTTGQYVFYTETITTNRARCIDGIITVARAGDRLSWNWFASYKGKPWVAYADLAASH